MSFFCARLTEPPAVKLPTQGDHAIWKAASDIGSAVPFGGSPNQQPACRTRFLRRQLRSGPGLPGPVVDGVDSRHAGLFQSPFLRPGQALLDHPLQRQSHLVEHRPRVCGAHDAVG